jgi:AcrR family transcriptional regulator
VAHRRGPYRTGERRRAQILDAASSVFAEFGFAGGSVRAIAERVGVSPATLLQHFGSKEGLLMAVLNDWDRQTIDASLTGVSGLAYFGRMPDVMRSHLHRRGLLELFATIAAEATSPSHPAHQFIQQRYASNRANLSFHLRQAIADGDIAPLSDSEIDREARLLDAVLDGIGLQWLLDSSTDMVACVADYIDHSVSRWRNGLQGSRNT